MKRLRQLCAVTLLTLSLTNFTLAEGTMWPGYAPPPPPPPVESTSQDFRSTNETELEGEEPTLDLETEIMLLVIRNMLALL